MGALREQYDVAIVGGGPAGTSTAIRLADAGLSVLLVEQKKFPREKLCGEFISPECLAHFEKLGVKPAIMAAGGVDLHTTEFISLSGRSISVESKWFGAGETLALGLSRAAMDAKLLERAREAGVDVSKETTASGLVIVDKNVVGIKIRSKEEAEIAVSARITIDATGRTRSLARRIENGDADKSPAKFVAFKTHIKGANVADGKLEIYGYRGGYGGCSRVENDRYNLCFIATAADTKRLGSNAERVWREVMFTNDRARDAMKDAEIVMPWHAVPITRYGRGELSPAEGLITIGDAASFIDPFTGSGILLALDSGKIAADAVIDNFAANEGLAVFAAKYKERYAAAFDRRLRISSFVRHFSVSPLAAEILVAFLGLSPRLRQWLAHATRSEK